MKKLLVTLSILSLNVAPVSSIISCGKTSSKAQSVEDYLTSTSFDDFLFEYDDMAQKASIMSEIKTPGSSSNIKLAYAFRQSLPDEFKNQLIADSLNFSLTIPDETKPNDALINVTSLDGDILYSFGIKYVLVKSILNDRDLTALQKGGEEELIITFDNKFSDTEWLSALDSSNLETTLNSLLDLNEKSVLDQITFTWGKPITATDNEFGSKFNSGSQIPLNYGSQKISASIVLDVSGKDLATKLNSEMTNYGDKDWNSADLSEIIWMIMSEWVTIDENIVSSAITFNQDSNTITFDQSLIKTSSKSFTIK